MKTCIFLGSKSFGLAILKALYASSQDMRWLIVHPDDTNDGRSCLEEFNSFARLCNLDVMVAANSAAAAEMVKDSKADIGFVCGWYWMIGDDVLRSVPGGLWGAHNSLLPAYRGNAPLVWSIINGDTEVGSTVFQISKGMDDGKVLHQVRVACGESDSIATVLAAIESRLVEELPAKWEELISGDATLIDQDERLATYCGMRTPEDGQIDWHKPARDVHNFIRAQSDPYPCAFSYVGEEKVSFLSSRLFGAKFFGTPGQILMRSPGSVVVSCGENTAIEIMAVRVGVENKDPAEVFRSLKGRMSLKSC